MPDSVANPNIPPNGGKRNSGRVRATKACDMCSKLRQKCSGEQPCSSCIGRDRECSYTRKAARRGPPKLDTLLAAKRMLEEQLLLRTSVQNAALGFGNVLTLSTSTAIGSSMPFVPKAASSSLNLNSTTQHILHPCAAPPSLTASSSSSTLAAFVDADAVHQKNITPISASSIPKPSSVSLLSPADFCFLMVWDQSDWMYFLEYYFKHLYASFPFLDQEWFTANLLDVPLYYLHAMYACALVTASSSNGAVSSIMGMQSQGPSQSQSGCGDAAHMHYKAALKLIMDNLEKADPFMVAALYHLFNFALSSSFVSDQIAVTHYELAIGLAHVLELWKSDYHWQNREATSKEATENQTQNQACLDRFSLGVWFAIQIMDARISFIFCMPSRLSSRDIDLRNIGHFYMAQLPVLSLNPSPRPIILQTHHQHDLALIDYSLPLINLMKKIHGFREGTDLSPSQTEAESLEQAFRLKYDLDRWFASIPPGLQIWPGQYIWKGAQVMELNCMYHVASIFLFVSQSNTTFLTDPVSFQSVSHSANPADPFSLSSQSPASLCMLSANQILSMSQTLNQQFSSYLSISSSPASTHIPLPTLLFLQYAIFVSALTMCAVHPDMTQVRIHVEYHLLYALRICGASCAFVEGPLTRESTTFDADLVRSCIGYPERAIHVLRQRMVL